MVTAFGLLEQGDVKTRVVMGQGVISKKKNSIASIVNIYSQTNRESSDACFLLFVS